MYKRQQDVDARALHIHGDMPCGLRRVDHEQGTGCVRDGGDTLDVDHVSREVRGVAAHHHARGRRDRSLERTIIEHVGDVEAHVLDLDVGVARQHVERAKHRVVLRHRGDHAVMRAYEPEDGRVERLRGVGGEDDAVGMAAAQKVGHGHAARERGARRGQVALSRTAARTPECRHRGGHRIDYARRPHERCRRAIEIYHRIHLPFAPTIPSLQGPERIVPRAAPHEPEGT